MPYKDNMNSNDNYGEINKVPTGSNEEKLRNARQRTSGSDKVINHWIGDMPRKHNLGKFDKLTKH